MKREDLKINEQYIDTINRCITVLYIGGEKIFYKYNTNNSEHAVSFPEFFRHFRPYKVKKLKTYLVVNSCGDVFTATAEYISRKEKEHFETIIPIDIDYEVGTFDLEKFKKDNEI